MIATGKRFELIFLASLPSLITLGLAIFFLSSKHLSGLGQFMPALPLMPVFYWGLTYSRDMPYWFLFVLGLAMDAVMGAPLGLSSLLYMAFLKLTRMQRRFIHKEGFVIKWGYFAILLAVIDLLDATGLVFFNASIIRIEAALLQWLLTVCCYPILHKIFDGLAEHISSRRWQILHGS
jgi:rod shape-determining protein MreD